MERADAAAGAAGGLVRRLLATAELQEQTERPVPVVECWLRCAGVLRERRLAEGLERLEERLPGPVREAREELALAPLVDDVETVVLALGELRVP